MIGDMVWVSVLCEFGTELREFRGQVSRAAVEGLIASGSTPPGFLRMVNTYFFWSDDEDEPRLFKYGGSAPSCASATGECFLRTDTICYIDLLKGREEFDRSDRRGGVAARRVRCA
jgi:hypothetical protein